MSQINVDTIAPATSGRAVGIATPLFILHKPSGNQSISNATGTVVTWGTADVDTHNVSDLANNRIVIMPGSGISKKNLKNFELFKEVHGSFKDEINSNGFKL